MYVLAVTHDSSQSSVFRVIIIIVIIIVIIIAFYIIDLSETKYEHCGTASV